MESAYRQFMDEVFHILKANACFDHSSPTPNQYFFLRPTSDAIQTCTVSKNTDPNYAEFFNSPIGNPPFKKYNEYTNAQSKQGTSPGTCKVFFCSMAKQKIIPYLQDALFNDKSVEVINEIQSFFHFWTSFNFDAWSNIHLNKESWKKGPKEMAHDFIGQVFKNQHLWKAINPLAACLTAKEVYNSTLIHLLVIATLFYHGAMHVSVSIQQLEDNVTLGHMKDAFCNPPTSAKNKE